MASCCLRYKFKIYFLFQVWKETVKHAPVSLLEQTIQCHSSTWFRLLIQPANLPIDSTLLSYEGVSGPVNKDKVRSNFMEALELSLLSYCTIFIIFDNLYKENINREFGAIGEIASFSRVKSSEFDPSLEHQCWGDLLMLISIGLYIYMFNVVCTATGNMQNWPCELAMHSCALCKMWGI